MQFQLSPTVALTQLLSAICNFVPCVQQYPSPVSFSQGNRPDSSPSYVVVNGSQVLSNSSTPDLNFLNNTANDNDKRGRRRHALDHGAEGMSASTELLDALASDRLGLEENGNVSDSKVRAKRPPPLVHTGLGRIEGYFMKVVGGREIYAFEGIPYAQSPIGKNRFQAPIPVESWQNLTLMATHTGADCIQVGPNGMFGEEDCLTMNIYSPQIPHKTSNPKRPVFIFIHGGWFWAGSGSNFGPAYLLQKDVILVTFNYRLGILGSFTTGDTHAPGNWAMKDQALAINFVHKHIASFGGDPDRIILMGQSAGAVSVHLQMMSPMARDKISGAILISGGAYNPWGFNTLEQSVKLSKTNAQVAFCPPFLGSKALLECMQSVAAEVLVANQYFTVGTSFPTVPTPTIEPPNPTAFLTESPDEAYRLGHVAKVPMIATITSEEIHSYLAEIFQRGGGLLMSRIFDQEAPLLLGLRARVPAASEEKLITKIRRFYGIGKRRSYIPRRALAQIGQARYFQNPFQKQVQMHSQIAPTFAGVFNYTNFPTQSGSRIGLDPKEVGVTHADDLQFIFNSTKYPPILRDEPAFAVIKLLLNVYSNFGESRIPYYTTPDGHKYRFWEEVTNPDNFKLLQIDEEVKMKDNPYQRAAQFWESLNIPDAQPYLKLKRNDSEVAVATASAA